MSRTVAIYTIIAVLGVAVFGFLGINFMNANHASCIVSTSRGGFCPEQFDPLGFINFHFNALKGFSTAVFGANLQIVALAAMLVFALAAILSSASKRRVAVSPISPFVTAALPSGGFISPSERRLIHWLSLRENSPAPFTAAA